MVAQRIKALRSELKISQEELASRIGISRSALSLYEIGRREPDFDIIQRLASLFGVSVDYLLGRTDLRKDLSDIEMHASRAPGIGEDLPEEGRKELLDYYQYLKQKYGKKK